MRTMLLLFLVAPVPYVPGMPSPEERFREAGDLARSGDGPKAIAIYRDLAGSGIESASLYWNWAQAAASRGAVGEALWALLRARELSPGEAALSREIEKLRGTASLDPAEIAPEPLATLGRTSRRFRLDLLALVLLGLSLPFHAARRLLPAKRWPVPAAWAALALGSCLAGVPLGASLARPTGVVVQRGAPLVDAASPTAEVMGSLREGEAVPLLGRSGDYVRVEDSSGGWARAEDVWPVGRAPAR